jgi:hypothetical protein
MVINDATYPADRSFDGLVVLLAHGLPELAAHSAYTGLLGYFIGLSVLWPGMAVFLIPLGWLSAAVLHGAWDATGDLFDSAVIVVPVRLTIGVLSYALLAGAIFKARDISPRFAKRCAMLAGARPGETKSLQVPPQGVGSTIDLAPASKPRPETDTSDKIKPGDCRGASR